MLRRLLFCVTFAMLILSCKEESRVSIIPVDSESPVFSADSPFGLSVDSRDISADDALIVASIYWGDGFQKTKSSSSVVSIKGNTEQVRYLLLNLHK